MNISDDKIIHTVKETKENTYLVGGYVRDFLLGKKSYDRDIVIKGAENFSKKLAEKLNATFIVLDSENQIFRLVLEDKINYLDISEMVGESINEDLLRRDFTINAIAYDIQHDKYIDTTCGLEDLKSKKIKTPKEENFKDDPLRVLRAFRFVATLDFDFSNEVKSAINKYKNLLKEPAKERINYELLKLFGGNYTSKALLIMDEFGILEQIFPCINDMKKVTPNSHHHLDLFHHVVESVRNVEQLYLTSDKKIQEHLNRTDFGGFPRLNHLKLACFLHDIGKFSTWTIEETGRHRFIKHDEIGSKMCIPLLKELKFSKKQIEYISKMIKNHIYPSNVIVAPDLSEKIMTRYIRKMESDVIDNIILAKADRLSAKGEAITQKIIDDNINGLDKLLNFYLDKKDSLKPLPKLLDGTEIMTILNIQQTPELGKIIKKLHEEQLSGNINTKQEAIAYIKCITK